MGNKPLPNLHQVNGFRYDVDELILDPKAPIISAKRLMRDRFIVDAGQTLHRQADVFYGWTGTHYIEIPANFINADIYHFLDCARIEKKGELVRFEPNRSRVGEIQAALGAVAFLSEAYRSPSWLSAAPDLPASEIISCENGLLHLPTRELLPHTPEFFTVNAIDYPYSPRATPPLKWLSFLRQLWGDDQQSIDTLQEIFGYCLMADTSQQKAFMLVGPKRSGKSTIARILESVIGHHNTVSPTLANLGTTFGLQSLIHKRLAIISDARIGQKTDTSVVAERLLSITGEDTITADRKFLPAYTGKFDVRFFIISNELPRLADASGALPSRIVMLVVTTSFYGREDRSLTSRLMGERPGILNWSIGGYERLCDRGHFIQPESALEAAQELDDIASPISAFLRDACVVDPARTVSCDMLFSEWQNWCKSNARDFSGTKQGFGISLRAALPNLSMTRPRGEGVARNRFYQGIGLR